MAEQPYFALSTAKEIYEIYKAQKESGDPDMSDFMLGKACREIIRLNIALADADWQLVKRVGNPPMNGRYLVKVETETGGYKVIRDYDIDLGWRTTTEIITHWMRLPEDPRES